MHSSDRSGEMTFIPGDDVQTFLFWRIGCVVPSSSEAYFSFFLSFRRCRRTADATKNHQTKLCSRYKKKEKDKEEINKRGERKIKRKKTEKNRRVCIKKKQGSLQKKKKKDLK